jgi:diguanylate cyclase (GGDEF)-like protein
MSAYWLVSSLLTSAPGLIDNGPAQSHVPSYVSTGLQTATVLMVAVLMWFLYRVIGRRFVQYWAMAWTGLFAGLLALNVAFQAPAMSRMMLSLYWVAGDLFGFLLFAGCRDYARNIPLHWKDLWLLAPPVLLGIILPGTSTQFQHINSLFPPHAIIFGGYCLLAFAVMMQAPIHDAQTRMGVRMLQVTLLGLVILFWHYAVVLGRYMFSPLLDAPEPTYLQFSALYDSFAEVSVAFAQVVLATDTVRRELADANRQLAAASQQLELTARTDALTGLLNRRAFDAMLADTANAPPPGSVAMIDVDGLKPLNDRHGHTVGDSALRAVARALQNKSRIGDPMFRLGGDEFLLILPGVGPSELTRRMEDLDQALLSTRLPGLPGPIDLAVSWGVAEYPDRAGIAKAVEQADAAMYACKQSRSLTLRIHAV